MARYFFDTDDGQLLRDEIGVELGSLAMARREAAEAAGRMIIDCADELGCDKTWQLFVRDEDGHARYWITVIATELGPWQKPAVSLQPWLQSQAGSAEGAA